MTTNLETIKSNIKFVLKPEFDYDILEHAMVEYEGIDCPIRDAILENNQEVIEFLENATLEERIACHHGVKMAMQEFVKRGIVTESVDSEFHRTNKLWDQMNTDMEKYLKESNDIMNEKI